jgi:hypothetical protein
MSIIEGVDATQNVRISGIQGVDDSQNSAILIIQGVDLTQNTQIAGIQGVDLAQNTSITQVNQYAASGYALANTNAIDIAVLQGVDTTQNNNIIAVNNFAAGAYEQANTANARAFNTVLKSGDTMSGALNIASPLTGTTTWTAALGVNGSIASNNSMYLRGTAYVGLANGQVLFPGAIIEAIGDSQTYAQIVMQNRNSNVNASSDIVATADNGNDTSTFIDMGINSSNYNQAGFELTGPNDGYLYVSGNTSTGGGSLVLSTITPKDIIFSLNGQGVGSEIARFQYDTGLVLKNRITFADSSTQNTAAAPANYTQSAFNTANGANGMAIGAYNTANGANGMAIGAYGQANTATTLAQEAFNRANTETDLFGWKPNTILVANNTGYQSNSNSSIIAANNTMFTGDLYGGTIYSNGADVIGTALAFSIALG